MTPEWTEPACIILFMIMSCYTVINFIKYFKHKAKRDREDEDESTNTTT